MILPIYINILPIICLWLGSYELIAVFFPQICSQMKFFQSFNLILFWLTNCSLGRGSNLNTAQWLKKYGPETRERKNRSISMNSIRFFKLKITILLVVSITRVIKHTGITIPRTFLIDLLIYPSIKFTFRVYLFIEVKIKSQQNLPNVNHLRPSAFL